MAKPIHDAKRQFTAQPIHLISGGNEMPDNALITYSKAFAVDVIRGCETMRSRGKNAAIINQLLRSGTSIGANIHEANYAFGRSDFVFKLQISLKECYETEYWLDVFHQSELLTDDEYKALYNACSKIRRLLIASLNTAKENGQ